MHKSDLAGAKVPLLLPIFGGTDKKPRLVDRDVIAVGRARGCDIVLEANEVSAVHCILYRAGEGLRLRDCGSRTATRVNGAPVKNSPLNDGDVVQIGPFSFEIRLPPGVVSVPSPDEALSTGDDRDLRRLMHARRNLVRLALGLRRKVATLRNGKAGSASKSSTELQTKIRNYEQRVHQLEDSDRELHKEREQLAKEREAHAQRVQQMEGEFAQRLEAGENEIKVKWNEFQQRCATEQERLLDEALKTAGASGPKGEDNALRDHLAELERREQEFKKREELWTRREKELTDELEGFERQRGEFQNQRGKTVAEQAKARQELDQQRVAVGQTETAIREQKAELTKMVADLKKMQEDMRKQGPELKTQAVENQQLRQRLAAAEERLAGGVDPEKVEAVLAENEQARQTLADNVKRLTDENESLRVQVRLAGGSSGKEVEILRRENEQLRQLLQTQLLRPVAGPEMEALRGENQQLRKLLEELDRSAGAKEPGPEMLELQQEVELLRQLLEEKDKSLEQSQQPAGLGEAEQAELLQLREEVEAMRKQLSDQPEEMVPGPSAEGDLASYEAELNRYRQQLGSDRLRLNKEIESLRQRNGELDEATREMELELSRERAEMARERIRLDRLRDEIKNEMERLQRDGGVRESLASVERLRDELRPARR